MSVRFYCAIAACWSAAAVLFALSGNAFLAWLDFSIVMVNLIGAAFFAEAS